MQACLLLHRLSAADEGGIGSRQQQLMMLVLLMTARARGDDDRYTRPNHTPLMSFVNRLLAVAEGGIGGRQALGPAGEGAG